MLKEVMDCFSSSNKEINVNIGKIWICLAEELVSDLEVDMIEKFENFEEFFIWPANYLHLLDEQTTKVRNTFFLLMQDKKKQSLHTNVVQMNKLFYC